MTTSTIELIAGLNAQQQPIVEQIDAHRLDEGLYQLARAPAFVKGLSRDDTIRHTPGEYTFTVTERSGNVTLQMYTKTPKRLAERLAPLDKLGAQLDGQFERLLVYSIHVSCGFNAIEAIINPVVTEPDMWVYGNVYDLDDGSPLNWWQSILAPQ